MIFPKRTLCKPAFLLTIFFLLTSCASLQTDRMVSSADHQTVQDLAELESLIVPLDVSADQRKVPEIRQRITALESQDIRDYVFEARLSAWSGRLYVIEGNKAAAERQLRRATTMLPGDVYAGVLSARLVSDPNLRLESIESSLLLSDEQGPLLIEKALTLVALRRYQESVASFDQAFPLLPELYRQVYQEERNRAWEMRLVTADTGTLQFAVLSKTAVTWRDVLLLTQTDTLLFQFITAGKTWTAGQLFDRLSREGFFLTGGTRTVESQVSRGELSYFFWILLARNRSDPSMVNRYSQKMLRLGRPVSPIPDVSIDMPVFDAVMGCIEWEIMSLPDGRNFFPHSTVQGTDFSRMLKQVSRSVH